MNLAIEAVWSNGALCWLVWGDPANAEWPRIIGQMF